MLKDLTADDIRRMLRMRRERSVHPAMAMRVAIAYPHWKLPLADRDPEAILSGSTPQWDLRGVGGATALPAYLDDQALRHDALPRPKLFIEMSGEGLFGESAPQVGAICLEPDSTDRWLCGRDELLRFRRMVAAHAIERALEQLRAGTPPPNLRALFTKHADFLLPYCNRGLGVEICRAPDERGRDLLAVFTAEDCLEDYRARLPAGERDSLTVEVIDGEALCAEIVLREPDGFVFNCATFPLAFQATTARLLLGLQELPGID